MLDDIPKVAEYGILGGGALGGLWLVVRAFIKKNVTEKAEVNIYTMQAEQIVLLNKAVAENHTTIMGLYDKMNKLEIAQAKEAVECSKRIGELEQRLNTLNQQATLQATIDQAGRDGLIDRRKANR